MSNTKPNTVNLYTESQMIQMAYLARHCERFASTFDPFSGDIARRQLVTLGWRDDYEWYGSLLHSELHYTLMAVVLRDEIRRCKKHINHKAFIARRKIRQEQESRSFTYLDLLQKFDPAFKAKEKTKLAGYAPVIKQGN